MNPRRNAIVTGSTSGIGLGIARSLAHSGLDVMLNGLGDPTEIEAIRASLAEETGARIAFHGADMSKPDEIADLVETTRRMLGAVDVVVNNAGIQTVAPIEDFPIDRYNLIIAVDMSSAWHMTRLTMAEMKQRRWGRIINVASAHGLVASPYKSAYVMAKHGILGLTKN